MRVVSEIKPYIENKPFVQGNYYKSITYKEVNLTFQDDKNLNIYLNILKNFFFRYDNFLRPLNIENLTKMLKSKYIDIDIEELLEDLYDKGFIKFIDGVVYPMIENILINKGKES